MTANAKFKITATDKTKAAFASTKKSLEEVSKRVLSLKTGIGALVGAVGFGALIKHSFDVNDSLAKVADSINMTTQQLGGLRYAAQLGGVDVGQMDKALQRMERSVGDARRGLTTTSDAFKALGLDVNKVAKMGAYQQFLAIAEGLKQIKSRADQATAAANIFGREGVGLLNVLDKGKGGIQAMAHEAEQLGISLNRVDAAKIEAANDAMTRAWSAVRGVANTIAVALAPYIQAVGDYLADAAKRSGGFKVEILDAVKAVTMGIAYLADMVRGLEVAWQFVKTGAIAAFGMVLEVVNNVTKGVITFVNKVRTAVGLHALPAFTQLDAKVQHLRQSFEDNNTELKKMALQGLPTQKVKAFFDEIQKRAEQSAVAVAHAKRTAMTLAQTGSGTGVGLSETEKANLKKKYDVIAKALMTENDRLSAHYVKQKAIIDQAYSAHIIPTEKAYQNELLQLKMQHEAKMGDVTAQGYIEREKFAQMSTRNQVTSVLGQLTGLTAGVATNNKAMFNMNKVFGSAMAIINTSLGVTKALSAYPPPLSFVMAAAQLAAGMAQVSAIKSASFGGSTSAPSIGGGGATPTTPAQSVGGTPNLGTQQQPTRPQHIGTVVVQSGIHSDQSVRDLVERLNEVQKDMGGAVNWTVSTA